uniref:PA14 domain-containing protein n=2 Tax=Clytia hemisphaerica TaxID=252671 RepID=A0A7M5X278_9CNID
MAAKLRRNSIFIASKISSHQNNVETLRDCFTSCSNHANCAMFAHRESDKRCMFFKEILAKEVISRLIYEGWKPGRINTFQKIILYIEDTCSEEYCQDSCLSGVKETCTPSTLSLPDCEPSGVYNGCDEARKASKIPVLSLNDPTPFDENEYQALVIEGIPAGLKCPAHVEYTRILENNVRCLTSPKKLTWGIVRRGLEHCITKDQLFSYNRMTGQLKIVGSTSTFSYFLKMVFHTYRYCSYSNWAGCQAYTPSSGTHLMPTTSDAESYFERTGFGALHITQGSSSGVFIGKMEAIHMIDYFIKPTSEPLSTAYKYNFTNIPGAVKASLYQNYRNIHTELETTTVTPTRTGRYDHFQSFQSLGDHYGIILQTYFIPPSDGTYRFILTSDDDSSLYISTDDQPSNKYRIIHTTDALAITDYSRQSSDIQLMSGRKYYMELIGREIGGGDYFLAGVILPSGDQIVPITYQY